MIPKKGLVAAAIVCHCLLGTGEADASFVNASYTWSGAKGWRAEGMIRYDDTFPFPTALGALYGGVTAGIDYLDLAIFDPSGAMRGSWIQIIGAVVQYNTLRITLNAETNALAAGARLDIGNTAVRSAYFGGTQGASLVIGWNYSVVDRGPGSLAFVPRQEPDPEPTPISVPGTAGLLVLGIGLVGAARRRGVGNAR